MVKAVSFQGFQNVEKTISKMRQKEADDRDFFLRVLEMIGELADLKKDVVLQAIVESTRKVLGEGELSSDSSNSKTTPAVY
jgi:ribosomal protein L15